MYVIGHMLRGCVGVEFSAETVGMIVGSRGDCQSWGACAPLMDVHKCLGDFGCEKSVQRFSRSPDGMSLLPLSSLSKSSKGL